jgi:hypothetical protein
VKKNITGYRAERSIAARSFKSSGVGFGTVIKFWKSLLVFQPFTAQGPERVLPERVPVLPERVPVLQERVPVLQERERERQEQVLQEQVLQGQELQGQELQANPLERESREQEPQGPPPGRRVAPSA